MADRTAYVFVFDGLADWEAASAVAELRRTFDFGVRTFALSKERVVSMGGITLTPDLLLGEIRPELVDLLILPGGNAWMEGEIRAITSLVRAVHEMGRPIAAICAATLSLAHAGLLNENRHTSNGEGFIAKYVPAYLGERLYEKARAVRDGNVITANGVAPFAFAAEIFRLVAPERAVEIATYEQMYSRGMLDE